MNWGTDIPTYSLTAIDKESYLETYNRLKGTYANQLKKVWNEKTDPDKFIHEDLGISSYLITLWQDARWTQNGKPNFVDMGCGNGLLTYLLTCEGYTGFGFDVRERKIWKCFDPKPTLMVKSFQPNDEELFSKCDQQTWLIGNHPDELTPWVPVLSRRLMCNFFIIPCCAYDFVGKFKREKDGKDGTSVYSSYLQFVRRLAVTCGYQVVFDRMRIPSTKRTCMIGKLDEDVLNDNLKSKECFEFCESKIYASETVGEFFTPRPAVEPVRNCTKIDPTVISETVTILFDYLLNHAESEKQDMDDVEKSSPVISSQSNRTTEWNCGKQDLLIKDAIKVVPPGYLKHMKAQHGGFQTLVKNHGHIFQIVSGFIRLRVPSDTDIRGVKFQPRPKTRRCYFYDHHPQKCPLESDKCRFLHAL